MTSARLEIHVINVGQGDSVLVVNRDLTKVAAEIKKVSGLAPPADLIDYLPYAVQKAVPLYGTVVEALLIDGGSSPYGDTVLTYLRRVGVIPATAAYVPNLSVMLSHHHDDHGDGLDTLLRRSYEVVVTGVHAKTGKPTSRKEKKEEERYRVGTIYRPQFAATKGKSNPVNKDLAANVGRARKATTAYPTVTRVVTIGPGGLEDTATAPTTFTLGKGEGGLDINVHVLAAAQGVWDEATTSIKKIKTKDVDQNDRSISVLVEYGSFRFYAAGDIAGNGAEAGGNTGANKAAVAHGATKMSSHGDVETVLGPAVKARFPRTLTATANAAKFPVAGQVTVMKASHHGSMSSNDVFMISALRPSIAVISSGVKRRFHAHPTQAVLNRLAKSQTPRWGVYLPPAPPAPPPPAPPLPPVDNTVQAIYVTEIASKAKMSGQKKVTAFNLDLRGAKIVGDIVVRPTDESVLAVQAASKFGTKLVVQVYGTGAQTALTTAKAALRPTETVGTTQYPIGPDLWEITH
ncbi:ComEC/Rec2 family competence protein [Parafrankia elaeagni]|uniref:ComEC/Rec2 family competence protein n=1 Tax=Parafrankia elaeagni TaxID=222534 RepID=UPI00037413F6|nr:hypothetical protein [Parafrankia elaeagni]